MLQRLSWNFLGFGCAAAVGAAAFLAFSPSVRGDNTEYQFWPEIDAYYGLGKRTRLLFTAASTHAQENPNDIAEAQFSANFDYTLGPRLRADVPEEEWSKNRYLWTRIGYRYVTSFGGSGSSYQENTGLAELSSRARLGGDVWFTDRLRVDVRNINGDWSERYRVRVGVEWETEAWKHPIVPYATAEIFYDTRYDKWSRTLYQTGVEVAINRTWRVEPYLAFQVDTPQNDTTRIFAVGLVFKYYH